MSRQTIIRWPWRRRVRPAERTRAYTAERWTGAKVLRVEGADACTAAEVMYPTEKGIVFLRVELTGERLTLHREHCGAAWSLR